MPITHEARILVHFHYFVGGNADDLARPGSRFSLEPALTPFA